MDAFAVGGLLAIAVQPAGLRERLGRIAPFAAAVTGLLVVGIAVSAFGLGALLPIMRTWGYSVTAVVWGSVLVLTLTSPRWAATLSHPLLRRFGTYSYAIFLFHYVLWEAAGPAWSATVGRGLGRPGRS